MKKTKKRALYIIAALLGVLFILACLAGFAACGGDKCADGHTWDDGEVTTEATCTETGVKTYTCTVCGETNTVTIEALGHNWVSGTAVDATCTTGGYTPQTCSRCEATQNINETDALGHVLTGTYTPAVIDSNNPSNPIVTTEGYWTYACGQCSATIDLEKDPVASVTLTVTDEESLAAAAAWTDVSGVVPTAVVDTYDEITQSSAGIALSSTLTVCSAIVLDLNGNTLSSGTIADNVTTGWTHAAEDSNGFLKDALISVAEGGALTVTDSDENESGKILYDYTGSGSSANQNWNNSINNGAAIEMAGGDLVLESGTIESSSVGISARAGSVTINDGVVYSTGYYSIIEDDGAVDVTINGGLVYGDGYGILVDGDSNFRHKSDEYQLGAVTTLTITDGVVYSGGTHQAAIRTESMTSKSSAQITISGGLVYGAAKAPGIFMGNGTLKISGGTIEGSTALEVQAGETTISGGTFVATDDEQKITLTTSNSASFTNGYALAIYARGHVGLNGSEKAASDFDMKVDVNVTGGTFDGAIYVSETNAVTTDGTNWTLNTADSEGNVNYKVTGLDALAGMVCKTVYDETNVDAVVGYVYTSRVSATASDSVELVIEDEKAYTAADVTVTYDPDSNTYTISGTSVAFDNDTLNDFWGNNAEKVSEHSSCEYITFTIAVGDGETVKITTYNGETVQKVRAMYGAGVDKTTNALKDENDAEIQEASSDTWVIDTTNHIEGDWKMVIEVIDENGTVTETYYVVFGTITPSSAGSEGHV